MIEARVKKQLGSFTLDSAMDDGGFVCLVGRNGSGKSSFLSVLSGHLIPDEGYVKLNGRDITRVARDRREVVAVTSHSFIPHLAVDDHLLFGARLRKIRVEGDHLSRVKEDLGITFQGRARNLSLGMRERLALATALLASPKAIVVDEAFANLHDRVAFIRSYRALAGEGRIDVVFSTQEFSDTLLAEHAYEIVEGKTRKVS